MSLIRSCGPKYQLKLCKLKGQNEQSLCQRMNFWMVQNESTDRRLIVMELEKEQMD